MIAVVFILALFVWLFLPKPQAPAAPKPVQNRVRDLHPELAL